MAKSQTFVRPDAPEQPAKAARSPDYARILRFGLAGLANTAFGYTVYALFVALGFHPQMALAFQFIFGVIWNFSIHGRFVFGVRGYGRFPHYVMAYVAVYLFNVVVLQGLMALGLNPYVSQAVALVPTVILSYVLVSKALVVPTDGSENNA